MIGEVVLRTVGDEGGAATGIKARSPLREFDASGAIEWAVAAVETGVLKQTDGKRMDKEWRAAQSSMPVASRK